MLKTNETPFWLVWNPAAQAPTVKHWTHEGAVLEAERLARNHRGSMFIVLASVEARMVDDMRVIDMRDDRDQIPF